MKRVLTALVVSAAIASSALAASVSYTNSATTLGNNAYANIALNKFNTGLGTLTGVTVVVNFSTLGGSFTITTPSGSEADVTFDAAAARLIIRQSPTNSLGFTQLGETSFDVDTTPVSGTVVPAPNGSQVFAVTAKDVFVGTTRVIATNFWSAYQSPTGEGSVIFQAKNRPDVSASGGDFTQSITNFTAATSMSVAYTYTPFGPEPVPEPATVMAGGLLVLIGAGTYLRRRRKSAVA